MVDGTIGTQNAVCVFWGNGAVPGINVYSPEKLSELKGMEKVREIRFITPAGSCNRTSKQVVVDIKVS